MKKPEYREARTVLAPEYALARAVIQARVTAGLTREQLGGRTRPSTHTLERHATATGTRLKQDQL